MYFFFLNVSIIYNRCSANERPRARAHTHVYRTLVGLTFEDLFFFSSLPQRITILPNIADFFSITLSPSEFCRVRTHIHIHRPTHTHSNVNDATRTVSARDRRDWSHCRRWRLCAGRASRGAKYPKTTEGRIKQTATRRCENRSSSSSSVPSAATHTDKNPGRFPARRPTNSDDVRRLFLYFPNMRTAPRYATHFAR